MEAHEQDTAEALKASDVFKKVGNNQIKKGVFNKIIRMVEWNN